MPTQKKQIRLLRHCSLVPAPHPDFRRMKPGDVFEVDRIGRDNADHLVDTGRAEYVKEEKEKADADHG